MKRAWVVIGANYGDEGKGLITDYLCHAHDAQLCVRFNGGAQAGHTVVTPKGDRHVFSHFSSGTFVETPTYLSRFFVVNPALFMTEHEKLRVLGYDPNVYVDPGCMVTTPVEMLINQALERQRGNTRHGSCGVGFGETIERHEYYPGLVGDVLAHPRHFMESLIKNYLPHRIVELGLDEKQFVDIESYVDPFVRDYEAMANIVNITSAKFLSANKRIVFEGAQGLLLDQANRLDFPHVTRSHTGIRNAAWVAHSLDVDALDAVYVTRSYLTRHGAGPLPNESQMPDFVKDLTNVSGPFQGALRYAPLYGDELLNRIRYDSRSNSGTTSIAMTCNDQFADHGINPDLITMRSFGPTRNDVLCVA